MGVSQLIISIKRFRKYKETYGCTVMLRIYNYVFDICKRSERVYFTWYTFKQLNSGIIIKKYNSLRHC